AQVHVDGAPHRLPHHLVGAFGEVLDDRGYQPVDLPAGDEAVAVAVPGGGVGAGDDRWGSRWKWRVSGGENARSGGTSASRTAESSARTSSHPCGRCLPVSASSSFITSTRRLRFSGRMCLRW